MTNPEFSNEFDVLYNSITSNQAPGLDEYEKSVFLTKAQDEIVKSYFNPRSNKTQEGFDGNEKRQIDFSMIIRSVSYEPLQYTIGDSDGDAKTLSTLPQVKEVLKKDENLNLLVLPSNYTIDLESLKVTSVPSFQGRPQEFKISPFTESLFDMRDNTAAVTLDDGILMLINEYVEVEREGINTKLIILPINYREYSRLMNKPYRRPLKNQAWRLLDNSGGYKKAEIVIGPNDSINKYVIRYVKRPRAIRLITFDDVTIDGEGTEQSCELDPILHPEILQRAVELAKAAYTGDLQSQIALGQTSQTNIGAVQASR